ncbi:hypothetical protein [Paraflavitalea sp. sgz302552]
MLMPNRSYTAGNQFRYGFNGQEKDTELNENITTALFWEYDSRTGRRWNLDPKPIESISPYATNNNNPIVSSDPEGDFPFIPFIVGFVADVVTQFVVNRLSGDSFEEAFKKINYKQAFISGVAAQLSGGMSLLTKAASPVTKLILKEAGEVIISTVESISKQYTADDNGDGKMDGWDAVSIDKVAIDVAADKIGGAIGDKLMKKVDDQIETLAKVSEDLKKTGKKMETSNQTIKGRKGNSKSYKTHPKLVQKTVDLSKSYGKKANSLKVLSTSTKKATSNTVQEGANQGRVYSKKWVDEFGKYYPYFESFPGPSGSKIPNPFYKKS